MEYEAIVQKLIDVFPPRSITDQVAPHDCPECVALREQLSGVGWGKIPGTFVREHPDVLPLLSPEAYRAFLPAWLRQGVLDPEGEVAGMLLVNLASGHDTTSFTVAQREMVVEVARFLARNDSWGPEDAENARLLLTIERAWQCR